MRIEVVMRAEETMAVFITIRGSGSGFPVKFINFDRVCFSVLTCCSSCSNRAVKSAKASGITDDSKHGAWMSYQARTEAVTAAFRTEHAAIKLLFLLFSSFELCSTCGLQGSNPFFPAGTCDVMRLSRNSLIRLAAASAPVLARPSNRTRDAPRSAVG